MILDAIQHGQGQCGVRDGRRDGHCGREGHIWQQLGEMAVEFCLRQRRGSELWRLCAGIACEVAMATERVPGRTGARGTGRAGLRRVRRGIIRLCSTGDR